MKVVITDRTFEDYEIEKEVLEPLGCELVVVDYTNEDDLIEAAKNADGLLNALAPVSDRVIQSIPELKVISRYGIGVDTIDIPAATERSIRVANVPDYCIEEVSDHALALIMAFKRKIVQLNNNVKNYYTWSVFDETPIRRSSSEKIGLISFGNIARVTATKLKAVGFEVLAYDPYCSQETAEEFGVRLVSKDELLHESDIISVHAPLTKETKHIISDDELDAMKATAVLINTGRGPIIEEKALIKALQNNQIAGAALDVIENEPISGDNPLAHMDNVVLTPHAAFYSEESVHELKKKTALNVYDVLQGKNPNYWVNKKV
ncbi:C-terminal binding protein [Salibacterium halotolerans]|uniref:D-3-phosphoglycerate dehydrogenase n=1 Tax=Salibacterium halotolerans TaxID=1884432 RepID=A0A1I5KYL8_9BACI|nr:C-terminal binding protein [Salibacterium halotolerans]SFO89571.1 D-3-phosphoglycerate dehydrogenase [Salibacterium halotolerans]